MAYNSLTDYIYPTTKKSSHEQIRFFFHMVGIFYLSATVTTIYKILFHRKKQHIHF